MMNIHTQKHFSTDSAEVLYVQNGSTQFAFHVHNNNLKKVRETETGQTLYHCTAYASGGINQYMWCTCQCRHARPYSDAAYTNE